MSYENSLVYLDNEEKDWDKYYYNICVSVAGNSKCWSRQIGAILVRDKCIVSTGYNGPPRKIPDCGCRDDIPSEFIKPRTCPRRNMGLPSGQGLEHCPAAHAEENAILTCARTGVSAKDTTMYMTCGIPCKDCMIKIINVGVKELVVTKIEFYDDLSKFLLEESDISVRLYNFI